MIFKKIPIPTLEKFHNLFRGSTENTFKICMECEGACEHKKVGTLLPGEKEYMAWKMDISVSEFESRYLDILEMDEGVQIHVLKLGELCPFLNTETDRCECAEFKPILCKIYPLVFTVKNKKVEFMIDDWCQLSKKKECRSYFENAIPLFSSLPVPPEWFGYAAGYDNLCFDYDQLRKHKKGKNGCEVFLLNELLSLLESDEEAASLSIDLDKEVGELTF